VRWRRKSPPSETKACQFPELSGAPTEPCLKISYCDLRGQLRPPRHPGLAALCAFLSRSPLDREVYGRQTAWRWIKTYSGYLR
jgi:hypothetical protein